ncbi:MAG TPA: prolyl oligopeptidase family serine peptidase [Dissulfurispiraceae bacterium]|nr:prolyl oligopeptidase family serine peptidase [Dissulfurispiraceae bacterium]
MKLTLTFFVVIAAMIIVSLCPFAIQAEDSGLWQDSMSVLQRLQKIERINGDQKRNEAALVSEQSLAAYLGNIVTDVYGGRELIIYMPSLLPPAGQRAMVVALHGGMGNARIMHDRLKMDEVAEKNGFIVAYLNGSSAAVHLPETFRAWNAGGGCCGKPHREKVDDIGYITGAVHYLIEKYGIDPARIFGTGHSNGAIMTQTLMCQTNLYQKAVSLAGSLMVDIDYCPAARGRAILAIHGTHDQNIPKDGGKGSRGVTIIFYRSETDSQARFRSAGGMYDILWVDSDHSLEHMASALRKSEGISLAEKEARFFGISQWPR